MNMWRSARLWAGLLLLEGLLMSFNAQGQEEQVLRSSLAGTWYPAATDALERELARYLDGPDTQDQPATDAPTAPPVALLLPHAGYRYSGMISGKGVRLLDGKHYSRVVILGPSHYVAMRNQVSITDCRAIATPLGEVPLDQEFVGALRQSRLVTCRPEAHEREHSVQIQLPLLQAALGEFRVVPIVCGRLDDRAKGALARLLLGTMDANTLVVASSDFTHYGERFGYVPFDDDFAVNLKYLDMGAWDYISNRDARGFEVFCDTTKATICGREPISVLLRMLPEGSAGELLAYQTSGAMTGDYRHSVSYVSGCFRGAWKLPEPPAGLELSEADGRELLALARGSLEHYFETGEEPVLAEEEPDPVRAGTFVTLYHGGRLRGCIGSLRPEGGMKAGVVHNALHAALRDPRFKPLQKKELDGLKIEVSVLTPPRAGTVEEIELGRHGIILRRAGRSSVFLPKVATDMGWTLEETLSQLSRKAGLEPDAWQGATFELFEALVFSEKR